MTTQPSHIAPSPTVAIAYHLLDWAGRTGRLIERGWAKPEKLQCHCGKSHQRIWWEDQPSGAWMYFCEIIEQVIVKDARGQYRAWTVEDFVSWLLP